MALFSLSPTRPSLGTEKLQCCNFCQLPLSLLVKFSPPVENPIKRQHSSQINIFVLWFLFSYNESAQIKLTILASLGNAHNLVALQNVVIKIQSNSTLNFGQEPEVDINDQVILVINKVSFMRNEIRK